ncbi:MULTISPECIES: HD domain-containing protein [unclassified Myroides]|uniref:HD domain-containing protein n=1 Tax=unclassified Myroides TaxID=2642485 RepID=UPI003D2F60A1
MITDLWQEIEQNYSESKRHYHNLSHLENLLKQLIEVKHEIENWETVLFTMFYHDIIYIATNTDNEEKSAELAAKRMKEIKVSDNIIENCKSQILATKKHLTDTNSDTNYFLDADISIFGSTDEVYDKYRKNVRMEYLYYPSVIYNKGRIQILKDFVNQDTIFKTEYFRTKFEKQARQNILKEIEKLELVKDSYYLNHSKQWKFNIEEDGDYSEFLYFGAELLDQTSKVKKIEFYPGFFDSGYYKFIFKNVKLHLEWEGMLGVDLRTESNPSDEDVSVAKEIYELLKSVRNKNYA